MSISAGENTQQPRNYLPTLDGWRAVAIFAVIIAHAFGRETPSTVNSAIVSLGQQGVSLFFAISGFLITTLLLDEMKAAGHISLRGFYIRRVFRILPPAYLYLTITVMFGFAGVIALAPGEIASAALVYNNYWPQRSWYTQHFWSLSMEEHFYLIWPFVLAIAGMARSKWIAAAGIAAVLIWRPWSVAHPLPLGVTELQRTDMRLDAFLWACLTAIAIHERGSMWRIIGTVKFHVCVLTLIAVIYAMAIVFPMQLTKLALQSALMPVIVVPTIFLPHYWISRILENALLRWVGRISYGIYLWQQMFFHSNAPNLMTAAKWFPLKLALLLMLTAASYKWIEQPLIRYGRRLGRPATMSPSKPDETLALRR